MAAQETHFDHGTARWAAVGAVLGVVAVGLVPAVVIGLTEPRADLIGVVALGAAFGGTGFGAMLGAVLGSLRAPALQPAPVRDQAADPA